MSIQVGPVQPSVYDARHGVTSAAIERTFAMGEKVAAINGIAVDANHQSLHDCQYLFPPLSISYARWICIIVWSES